MVDVSDESIELPPGFRFHPTDEEIITHYLSEKVVNISFTARAIGEVDLNKCEPWDLPKRARMGEKEWYFFCQRDRKYPTGMRTNRATEAGYWKATGKDKEIYKGRNCLVGMKKTLVFYTGRAPKGEKTNWVMHEYRLEGKFSYHNLPKTAKDEWVVCRVFHKSTGTKRGPDISGLLGMNSFGDEYYDSPSLPPLTDPPYFNTGRPSPSFIHNNDDNKFNGTTRTPSLLRTTDGYHFSHSTNSEDSNFHQEDKKNFTLSTNYTLASNNSPSTNCYSRTPFSNPFFFSPRSSNYGYLQQEMNSLVPSLRSSGITNPDQAILRALAVTSGTCDSKRQLKVEQFSSNQSMVSLSQDTGLSTDITTEISSMASKHDMGASMPYEDFECPSSAGPVVDLECLWNY